MLAALAVLAAPAQAAQAPAVSVGAVALPSATGPVVRVGTEGTYPPFSYVDPRSQQLTGYDIEVMQAVAKRAGWQVQFTQTTFDSIFPALDAKRIDAVANQITINADRQARYLFTQPYTYSHGVVVVAAGNTSIKSLADLKGKTAAESETSNWAQVARDAGRERPVGRGVRAGGGAAQAGPGRRHRQRQHRGPRLPRLHRLQGRQDRR